MKLAFLADIHGNLPALEAVLHDLEQVAPDAVYLLGDLVNRCPWSNEVLDILREKNWPSIQGNHDLIVGTLDLQSPHAPFGNRERFPDLWWTLEHIRPADRDFLAGLPHDRVINEPELPPLYLVHGVPRDPFVGFEPGATAANRQKANAIREPYILAGHTHQAMHEYIDGPGQQQRRQILNPGGVGISHSGDPSAHYLILHGDSNDWHPEFRKVPYPIALVAEYFHTSGFMAYAGPMGELHLRTVTTGHAWASDFNFWMRDQPSRLHADIRLAVETYFSTFPDEKSWAFPRGE